MKIQINIFICQYILKKRFTLTADCLSRYTQFGAEDCIWNATGLFLCLPKQSSWRICGSKVTTTDTRERQTRIHCV